MADPLRVDGRRKFARILLMGGVEVTDGPFWCTQSAGDLQSSNMIFVTNGRDVWPSGGVLALYAE